MAYLEQGPPKEGPLLAQAAALLARQELCLEEDLEWLVHIHAQDGTLLACGGLSGNLLKCLAVAEEAQGEGLASQMVTALLSRAFALGRSHLFLYTRPKNESLFASLGFYALVKTQDAVFMENRRQGLGQFLALHANALARPPVAAIVAHADPFTLGHRYLVEQALKGCQSLYVFVLSEDKGLFSAQDRLRMVREGTRDLPHVFVTETGPYMVSASLFPTYFLKDRGRADEVSCELDLRLFGEKIAPGLCISRRYVGTEPLCAITAAYNRCMKALLPAMGVEVVEIERRQAGGEVVSASRVRGHWQAREFEKIRPLVPETTWSYLLKRTEDQSNP